MFTNLVYRMSFVFAACVSTTDRKNFKLLITDGFHGSNAKQMSLNCNLTYKSQKITVFIFVTHVLVYENFY